MSVELEGELTMEAAAEKPSAMPTSPKLHLFLHHSNTLVGEPAQQQLVTQSPMITRRFNFSHSKWPGDIFTLTPLGSIPGG